ncbi:TRAP transporter small permease subunit [Halomonas sp. 25-S5]|uniref:TRAP transporter small permease n=1 Tax=Halomonas sp. 25-S5 TaxID=2994065 RepID=UPI002469B02A|nr:TRAP transporter small permease subunit [Halomonas sp. 25-S5]
MSIVNLYRYGAPARGLVIGLQRLSSCIAWVEKWTCVCLVASFSILLVANVIMRYVFSSPLYYAEEVSVIIMIWMSFLATSLTIRQHQLVAVTLFIDLLGSRAQRVAQKLADFIVLVMLITLTIASIQWFISPAASIGILITLGISKQPFLTVIPLFFIASTIHHITNIVGHWMAKELINANRP